MTERLTTPPPSKQQLAVLNDVRQNRREALISKFALAKERLHPKAIIRGVSEEQKQKLRDAAAKAGQYSKDHKFAIGAAAATLIAAGAGIFFWNKNRNNQK